MSAWYLASKVHWVALAERVAAACRENIVEEQTLQILSCKHT